MSIKRNIYLKTIPIDQALNKIKSSSVSQDILGIETIATHDAASRVTTSPIYAKLSSPTFHSAAMDGIAVKAANTFSAHEDNPLTLKQGQDFIPVNTGNPMPKGMDAVIMIENLQQIDDETVSIENPAFPWQHVRRIGEDIVATELLFPQNHKLTAYDIGALLSAGIWEVKVRQQVHIIVIPTGDEVLDFNLRPTPKPGQVVESNSQVLKVLANQWGCKFTRMEPVPDNKEALLQALNQALDSEAHIVVMGAGSSAGSKDFTRTVMDEVGEVLVHGINAMPGKPSLLGQAKGKLMVGAPGYPVSSIICFEQLLAPIVHWLEHKPLPQRPQISVQMTRKFPSKLGVEEFVRLSIGKVRDKYMATPLSRGAGMLTTLTKAQGLARIGDQSEGVQAGEELQAELLVNPNQLENVLVAVGSHDNTLDLLANELMALENSIPLASTHVGSMGGLTAMKNNAAHIAGVHLFDPQTEDYNFPFMEKYLGDVPAVLINLAIRHQGLIVAKGNPLGIQGVKDLIREDIRFINRQRGAGTRILLDYHLQKAEISPRKVQGYDKEEFTHMAVAVNVLSGAASCGLGIHAAAKALGLDFIPLATERYDLLIPEDLVEDIRVQAVLKLLHDENFKQKIKQLGGYEVELTGQTMRKGQGLNP